MADCFIGEIRMFAGNYAPKDWAACNGQLTPISQNQTLFSLIGTTFGGDGQLDFALPDLRGRVPIGQGQGKDLTARTLGQSGGTETVALTSDDLPAHNHGFLVAPQAATLTNPADAVYAALNSAGSVQGLYAPNGSGDTIPFSSEILSSEGGTGNHDNMMPFATLTFIIALSGLYPPRN